MPHPVALADLCALLDMQVRGVYDVWDRQRLAVIMARDETRRLCSSSCSEGPAGTSLWRLPR